MQEQSSPINAAIDIGSNTIHLVVARCTPDNLDIVEDRVEMVRIGESVTATGEISPQKRDATIALLRQYKEVAEKHGAEHVFVVATEAIRQASNRDEFLEQVKCETVLEVHLISGTAEAEFTFMGATYETAREPGAPALLGVMDLGGGSMELVTAKDMHITWRTSIPIGSGWLHDRFLLSNPPTRDELSVASSFLHTYLQGVHIKERPPVLIVTGGSANSLLLLARRAFKLEMQNYRLTHEDLIHCEGLMSALPAEEISQRYEQPLDRARILPAGALIIRMVMEHLGLTEIRISPHGIREGVLLAYARYGEHWLDYANGDSDSSMKDSRKKQSSDKSAPEHGEQVELFIQSGQRMLKDRLKKLFDWRDDVLKHEDIEAVHKMRVASRRLRATMDAFESCCKPKPFKKAYRCIKEVTDILGTARDTDVMVQGLSDQLEQVPREEWAGMEWLITRLNTYRQERQKVLEDFLNGLDEDWLKQQIDASIPKGALSDGKS